MNNFHEIEESNVGDILEHLDNNENALGENETVSNISSLRRKSPLYGYLVKHKRYERKINSAFSYEEINAALRSRKDNKSFGMGQIPSGIFRIFRIAWVNIYILKHILRNI